MARFKDLLKSNKIIVFFAAIYPISIASSMALMEALNWAWLFFALIHLFLNKSNKEIKNELIKFLKSPEVIIMLFIVWGFFTTIIQEKLPKGFFHHIGPLRIFFIYFLTRYTFRSKEEVFLALKILLLVAFLGAIYAFIQYGTGKDYIKGKRFHISILGFGIRAQSFFNSPLTFANAYMPFFIISFSGLLFLWKQISILKKILLLIISLCLVSAIVLSFSRYLVFALPLCVLIIVFLKNWKAGVVTFLALIILGVYVFSAFPGFKQKVISASDLKIQTNKYRVQLFRANYELIKENFWLGVGINNEGYSKRYLKKYYKDYITGHAHNHFIETFAENGFFGFIFFVIFNAWWLVCFWKKFRL